MSNWWIHPVPVAVADRELLDRLVVVGLVDLELEQVELDLASATARWPPCRPADTIMSSARATKWKTPSASA